MTSEQEPGPDPAGSGGHTEVRGNQNRVAGAGAHGNTFGDNIYLPPPPPLDWPLSFGIIPSAASAFQPRQDLRDALDRARVANGTVAFTQVFAGGGGVGKSQLAASLARQALASGTDLVAWINAAETTTATAQYAQVAQLVRAPGVTGKDTDVEADARAFLSWLATTGHSWLVVLDDVTDFTASGPAWPAAARTGFGRVLATTRSRHGAASGGGRVLVPVDTFTVPEADSYLSQRLTEAGHAVLRGLPPDRAALAKAMDGLPLALSHAAAYMINEGLNCQAYLALFSDRTTELDTALPADADGDAYGRSVTASLLLSLDAAARKEPRGLAVPAMRLAAMLEPTGHPADFWTTPPATRYLTAHRQPDLSAGSADPVIQPAPPMPVTDAEARSAVRLLHNYHLVTDAMESSAPLYYSAHALTARAARERDPDLPATAAAAASALLALWPASETSSFSGLTAALHRNVTALRDAAGQALWQTGGHEVFVKAGDSIGHSGRVAAARDYFCDLLDVVVPYSGPSTPVTLQIRSSLAFWEGESGDHVGAGAAFTQLLADQSELLGPDDPATLMTRSNLAFHQGMAGDPAGAAASFRSLLADRLRVLGPENPATLVTRSNIGFWLGEAGDLEGAAQVFREVLADRTRVLGPKHQATLRARSHLARMHGVLGHHESSLDELAAALAEQTSELGPDHPDVLVTRGSMAYVLAMAGRGDAALESYLALADHQEQVLGSEHPETLKTRQQAARLRNLGQGPN